MISEIFLQIIAFCFWYYTRIDSSPKIVCISDRNISYIHQLREDVKRATKISWKVANETNKHLSTEEALRIIDAYVKKKPTPAVFYLTIGANDLDSQPNRANQKYDVRWTESFEMKFRMPNLITFVSGQNPSWKMIFSSSRFRTVPRKDKQGVPPGQEAKVNANRRKVAQNDSGAFQNVPLAIPISKPLVESQVSFPYGLWNFHGVPFNFHKDGSVTLGGRQMSWRAEGQWLEVARRERKLSFMWKAEGNHLVLVSEFLPTSIVLKKNAAAVTSEDLFLNLLESWRYLRDGNYDSAESSYYQVEKSAPDEPSIPAALARIYWGTHREPKALEKVDLLKHRFKNNPDQATAEALFFAVNGASTEEKEKVAIEVLKKFPKSPVLWILLAEYSHEGGNSKVSADALRRSRELLPEPMGGMRKTIIRRKEREGKGPGNTSLDKALSRIASIHGKKRLPIVLVPYPEANSRANNAMIRFSRAQGGVDAVDFWSVSRASGNSVEDKKQREQMIASLVIADALKRVNSIENKTALKEGEKQTARKKRKNAGRERKPR